MTSFEKDQNLFNDQVIKNIIDLSKYKKNNNENSDDNFWDVDEKNIENFSNNFGLSAYQRIKQKIDENIKKNNEKKAKMDSFYNELSKPKKFKTMKKEESKKYRLNSVDTFKEKPKTKIKPIKVDELSVFKRNEKWLKVKQDNINKEIEKKINKKEKEINEYKKNKNIKKPSELEICQIFNEENNVKYKPENINFFIRLNRLREEKEKGIEKLKNNLSGKINVMKLSHYSGIQESNISKREMNKCKKHIHDKLKGNN